MLQGIKRDLEGFKPGYHQQNNPYMHGRYQQNNLHFLNVTSRDMPGSHQYGGSDCEDDDDDSDSDDSIVKMRSRNCRADCGHAGRPA